MPKAYILVGIPGSGKSTWIENQSFDKTQTAIVSTDIHVERYASELGKTYSEVFKDFMPTAVNLMVDDVLDAVENNLDIVWDQTSTTVLTRAKKFRMLPKHYEMIAVVFPTPDDLELSRRLNNRPGKIIPQEVIDSMKSQFEEPSEQEGFDKIIFVK
jgi:predicted kinase